MNKDNSNNEISLSDMIKEIWKYKYIIIAFSVIICAATVFIVVNMPNVYESSSILRPKQDSSEKYSSLLSNLSGIASITGIDISSSVSVGPYAIINTILKDKNFISSFVINNGFEKYVVKNYDKIKNSKDYENNKIFYISNSLHDDLKLSEDKSTGVITLNYRNTDRIIAKLFLDKLLIAVSDKYKNIEMVNIQQQINNFKDEISNTSDIVLKTKLSNIVAGLIQNKIISQAQTYYGFDILVAPATPDAFDKVAPKRFLICIISLFGSLLISVSTVITIRIFKEDN